MDSPKCPVPQAPRDPQTTPSRQWTTEHLVLTLTSVPGSTAACVTHGDESTVLMLEDYYALVADAAASAGGHVVKVLGDAAVVTFPLHRLRNAVEAMRSFQARATRLWRRFDERCHVEVKIGAGRVVCGLFGPPGDQRPDVYGDVLNQLFRRPSGEFILSAEVEAMLE